MPGKEAVELFLSQFLCKMSIYGIVFRNDRLKNQLALKDLDITPLFRLELIKRLAVSDYSAGPIVDSINHGEEMWVFGKDVRGRQVYIKITLGFPDDSVICISFHIAEHPMEYPFK